MKKKKEKNQKAFLFKTNWTANLEQCFKAIIYVVQWKRIEEAKQQEQRTNCTDRDNNFCCCFVAFNFHNWPYDGVSHLKRRKKCTLNNATTLKYNMEPRKKIYEKCVLFLLCLWLFVLWRENHATVTITLTIVW